MDQINPYQAPEPALPSATDGAVVSRLDVEQHDDLVRGFKLLKTAVCLFFLLALFAGFWDLCDAYCYWIDDPLENSADLPAYGFRVLLSIVGECCYLAGVYFCSTRLSNGVSRAPLLLSLILGAVIFPDQIYHYALGKPWIYFEGYGNTHAGFGLQFISCLSWMMLNFWLILWTAARHDVRNQNRVLAMLFLDGIYLISIVLGHCIVMLVFADQPAASNAIYAGYFLLLGGGNLALIVSNVLAYKVYSSFIAQRSEDTAHG